MKCPICGQDHAADASCSTFVRQGSGTSEMMPWDESSQTEHGASAEAESAAPSGTIDPLIGMTLGSFRIVKMIGKGGMGTVYRASRLKLAGSVAIKFLDEFEVELYCEGDKLIASGLRNNKLWNVREGREADLAAITSQE